MTINQICSTTTPDKEVTSELKIKWKFILLLSQNLVFWQDGTTTHDGVVTIE
jgi:hypothetical protein